MNLKAVLFDVDGTLVDSVDAHARAWAEAFREFGQDIGVERVRPQIGKGGDQLLPALLPPDILAREGKAIEKRRTAIFRDRHLPHLQPLPGARELVKLVDGRGMRVALASSAKGSELAALKRIVGLESDDLDGETSADDAQRSKPHPDIFLAALARLPGVTADEAIVVGDTPHDVEAARRAGMRCVALLSGGFSEEALRQAGGLGPYRDPAHLLEEFDLSPLGAGGMPD
jgi:HAD superfamily hydrolase (TIGR01509 family)